MVAEKIRIGTNPIVQCGRNLKPSHHIYVWERFKKTHPREAEIYI
jgi:hypothetical protein